MEAANISKEGWSAAEAMKQGLGTFSQDNEANTENEGGWE